MSIAGFFSGLFGGGNGSNPQVSQTLPQSCKTSQLCCMKCHHCPFNGNAECRSYQMTSAHPCLQGKNADILKNARQAKPTCPPAPDAAPSGKQLATFAGKLTIPNIVV